MATTIAGKPGASATTHAMRANDETAEIVTLPGARHRRTQRECDLYERIAELRVIAVRRLSTAISGLENMRGDADGDAVDRLISEFGLIRDEFGEPTCRNIPDREIISTSIIRLSGVSAGLEILKLSATLRQFATVFDRDSDTDNQVRDKIPAG